MGEKLPTAAISSYVPVQYFLCNVKPIYPSQCNNVITLCKLSHTAYQIEDILHTYIHLHSHLLRRVCNIISPNYTI